MAEAYVGFASCVAQAFKQQVNRVMGISQVEDLPVPPVPPEHHADAADTVKTVLLVSVLISLTIGVILLEVRVFRAMKKRWYQPKHSEQVEASTTQTSTAGGLQVLQGANLADVENAPTMQDLRQHMDDLQVKHLQEIQARDAQIEELKKELQDKAAEGLELWEDAKRQRKEANRLQSFAISATNSLRKMQREVNRLQRVIAQHKTKNLELQEAQRARREVLMLKELDLARREAEVSSLAQAEQDELNELRAWLAAPEGSGAKDEYRQIARLRTEVQDWQATYKNEKASWMRAICELTTQRDQHVCRADLFRKQLGQWREIFQETDLADLERQDWVPESGEEGNRRESSQSSPQVFQISSPRSEAHSSTE